jgi:hypothetical protein
VYLKTSEIICEVITVRLIPLTPTLPCHFTIPLKRNEHRGEGLSKIEEGLESERKERIRVGGGEKGGKTMHGKD